MKESDEKWDLGNLQEGSRTGSPDNRLWLSSRRHEPQIATWAGGGQWSPTPEATATRQEGGGAPGLRGGRASPHSEGTRLDAPS